MAKVARFHKFGGPEVLQLEDIDVGEPGANELRIRIEAIGLNRSEAQYRSGDYGPTKFPSLVGYEAAGRVDELGPGVHGFTKGQRVSVFPNYWHGAYGVCGEMAIVPVRSVVAAPPGLSAAEAATVWVQYGTAFALIEVAKMGIGDFVLIPAASSSVGPAAMQLANWAGAIPIALTRRSAKAEALKRLGAEHVIVTEESDAVAEVMRLTGGKGARIAFDAVAGPHLATLANAMADEGVVIVYGNLGGASPPFPLWAALVKNLTLRGFTSAYIWNNPERAERTRALIVRGLAEGHLKQVFAKTFPLSEIVEAYRYLESDTQIGKIVVTV